MKTEKIKINLRPKREEVEYKLNRRVVLLSRDRTVKGQLEGPPDKVAKMKDWLTKTGKQHIIGIV